MNSLLCRLLPALFAFFLAFEGKGQDTACHKLLGGKVSQAASMITAGRFEIATAALGQIEKEMKSGCPGDSEVMADIGYLRGNISLLQDDPGQALSSYRTARACATSLVQLSRIDQNIGAVYFTESNYGKAIRYFTHALAEMESSGVRLPRRFLDLYDNLGAASFENGDLDEAGRWWDLTQQMAEIFFPSDSVLLTKIAHNSALVLFGLKNWQASSEKFRAAMELNPQKNLPYERMSAMIRKNLAMSLMKSGNTLEARQLLEVYKTGEGPSGKGDPIFDAEILRLEAWISFSEGRIPEADSLLEAGTRLVNDTSRISFPGLSELIRFRLLRDRSSIYYLMRQNSREDQLVSEDSIYMLQQEAFRELEVLRTRDGSLAGFILVHDSVDVLLGRTLETGYSLTSQREGTAEELLSYREGFQRYPKRADAAAELNTGDLVSDSIVKRWLQLNRKLYLAEKKGIETADRTNETVLFNLKNEMDTLAGRILSPVRTEDRNAGSWLSNSEAILDFAVFEGRIYCFIIGHRGTFMVATEAGPLFQNDCSEFLASLGTADDRMIKNYSRQVSDVLVLPVMPFLNEVTRLYVVPGLDLDGLPFECLRLDSPESKRSTFLAEQFTISYHHSVAEVTPDSAAELTCNEPCHHRNKYDFIAFSPAYGGLNDQAGLTNAEGEVAEISELFRSAGRSVMAFTGSQADEPALLEEMPLGAIIHIATHSKVDVAYPTRSGLHLWKQSPAISGDELLDGILEMGEVRGLRINCDLLTLSSCTLDQVDEKGSVPSDRIETGFIDAGARRVLSSLWNVSDRFTRTFMTDFYRFYLEGNTFPESLRKAKVKMMKDPATASPYFWAAFILTTK